MSQCTTAIFATEFVFLLHEREKTDVSFGVYLNRCRLTLEKQYHG